MPAFYRATVGEFLHRQPEKLMLDLISGVAGMGFDLRADQHGAWLEQVGVLHESLARLSGDTADAVSWSLLLEYQIPGRGKRLDAVLLGGAGIIAVEFKVGASAFAAADKWQLREYCWNLRDFHRESEGIPIAPILVATAAPNPAQRSNGFEDRHRIVQRMLYANADTLGAAIRTAHERLFAVGAPAVDAERWDDSQTHPTRTVLAEAQRLFEAHDVREIAHAYADNTGVALNHVLEIARGSREHRLRSICFVTGVPGAGKTLVGLHVAYSPAVLEAANGTATFASGNLPLLKVLNAALALNRMQARRERREIEHAVSAPADNVHSFALRHLLDPAGRPPLQQVVVFDEAQRVWTPEKVAEGLRKRLQRGQLTREDSTAILATDHSEPDFLLRVMERCPEWCLIVALVGGGQEINEGEAGLRAWGTALSRASARWTIWASGEALEGGASVAGQTLFAADRPANLALQTSPELHLSIAKRSLRAEHYAEWVNHVLDWRPEEAANLMPELSEFPMFLTRDLAEARRLLRDFGGEDVRSGLVASSGAMRLRADGIELKREFRNSLSYPDWFLRPEGDIRSSNQLEVAATEFECQGLELDWTCVCWGGDLIPAANANGWDFRKLHGRGWRPAPTADQEFVRNKYRVLLTRARFGTVIFIPRGSASDATRRVEEFDALAAYLQRCGLCMPER